MADGAGARIASSIASSYGPGGSISSELLGIFNAIQNPTADEWLQYTVLFNSATQTSVRLYFTQCQSAISAYVDDWELEVVTPQLPGELTNGDFEYADETEMKADFGYGSTAVRDNYISLSENGGRNGSKALYYGTGGSNGWGARALYKTVAVEPNTDYKWTLWLKFTGTAEYLAGIAVADSEGARIASGISSNYGPGGSISSGLLGIFNAIQIPTADEWLQYTVLFNSGTQTSVRLYFAQSQSAISAYVDDWELKEEIIQGRQEILINGDFEQGSTSGFHADGNVTMTINEHTKYMGNYSVKSLTNTKDWSNNRVYYDASVENNTDYLWSLWVYFESAPSDQDEFAAGFAVTDTNNTGLIGSLGDFVAQSGSAIVSNSILDDWIVPVRSPSKGVWHKYMIYFNSGDNATVRLSYINYSTETVVYLDNWSLMTEDLLPKGNFEYANEAAMKENFYYASASVRDNYISLSESGGRNSSKALYYGTGGTNEWAARALYRTVAVESNTVYKWTLWAKFTAKSEYMAGLAVADKGGARIDSLLATPERGGFRTAALMGIFTGITNPEANVWHQYTVTFNSGENTQVRLYFTQCQSNISVYLDDWSLRTLGGSGITDDSPDKTFCEEWYNQIKNGSIEYAFTEDDWSGISAMNRVKGKGEPTSAGNYYAQLSGNIDFSKTLSVKAGTEYTFSFSYKTDAEVELNVGLVDSDGNPYFPARGTSITATSSVFDIFVADDEWHRQAFTLIAPDSGEFDFIIKGAGLDIQIDELALFEIKYGYETDPNDYDDTSNNGGDTDKDDPTDGPSTGEDSLVKLYLTVMGIVSCLLVFTKKGRLFKRSVT